MTAQQLLEFTPTQMEMLVLDTKLNWASIYSYGNPKMCQKLLVDKRINSWFDIEFKKLLNEFKTIMKPYLKEKNITITQQERIRIFIDIIARIFKIYPSVLLKDLKRTIIVK